MAAGHLAVGSGDDGTRSQGVILDAGFVARVGGDNRVVEGVVGSVGTGEIASIDDAYLVAQDVIRVLRHQIAIIGLAAAGIIFGSVTNNLGKTYAGGATKNYVPASASSSVVSGAFSGHGGSPSSLR